MEKDNVSPDQSQPSTSTAKSAHVKKPPKRGIIYLSDIPPYMDVARTREFFSQYGKVGRIHLHLFEPGPKNGKKKTMLKGSKKRYTEGWVEFERKFIAKRVAKQLNNTQVSTRKKSKQYDSMWSMKYLSSFKWAHLSERLAYEKATQKQKLRNELHSVKKQNNFF